LGWFREDVNCEVVFLNKNEPDLEFEGLLKREKTRVAYFQVREGERRERERERELPQHVNSTYC
jgi:hypothetical protein